MLVTQFTQKMWNNLHIHTDQYKHKHHHSYKHSLPPTCKIMTRSGNSRHVVLSDERNCAFCEGSLRTMSSINFNTRTCALCVNLYTRDVNVRDNTSNNRNKKQTKPLTMCWTQSAPHLGAAQPREKATRATLVAELETTNARSPRALVDQLLTCMTRCCCFKLLSAAFIIVHRSTQPNTQAIPTYKQYPFTQAAVDHQRERGRNGCSSLSSLVFFLLLS